MLKIIKQTVMTAYIMNPGTRIAIGLYRFHYGHRSS